MGQANQDRNFTLIEVNMFFEYEFFEMNNRTIIESADYHTFLGNCPPTLPLSQHFTLSEKQVLMLA